MTGMDMPYGASVVRLRRSLVEDPYSGEPTMGDWSSPNELPIEGAFVASSSGVASTSEDRSYIVTFKSLYCDPSADVLAGDRIRSGSTVYSVPTKPEADTNPFTGWQPIQEIPLKEVTG